MTQIFTCNKWLTLCVSANRMRKDCHAAAHHDRGNVEEVDSGGGSSSSNNSTGNSSQSSSSQPTRDGTPQLQTSSQEVHQRAGMCTIYLPFFGVFSWGTPGQMLLGSIQIWGKTYFRKKVQFVSSNNQEHVGDGFLILFQVFTGRM